MKELILCLVLCILPTTSAARADEVPQLSEIATVSPLDGEKQPILYWAPESAASQATPLFVFLHSWSSDYRQDNQKWLAECVRKQWIWLHPDFRGANDKPKACGSRYARQDVLDAVEWAFSQWQIDPERVYLAGVSGGGHMSLLMAGHHPEQFSAVSAWVGPTDLAAWHQFHTVDGKPSRYAAMIEQSLGGPPVPARLADYQDRSPVFHLHRAVDLPVSIWAGVEDGHSGSVPVTHSLEAFNALATAHGTRKITPDEMEQLRNNKRLQSPLRSDSVEDSTLGREVFLRRMSGDSMVTIFAGGHESIPEAATAWLETRKRTVRRTR